MDSVLLELLPKLRCPDQRTTLREASAAEVDAINQRIAAGTCVNVGGEVVSDKIDAALVRAAGDIAYPVRREIPILIVEEGIPIAG